MPGGLGSGLSRAHSWAAGTLPILPVLPVRSLGGGFEAGITGERRSGGGGESGEESCHSQPFKNHCCLRDPF